jgi:hypothetical protein
MRARLGETRFVEDQNARALWQRRPQAPPHHLGVPRRVRDEVLEGLIGGRLADAREMATSTCGRCRPAGRRCTAAATRAGRDDRSSP